MSAKRRIEFFYVVFVVDGYLATVLLLRPLLLVDVRANTRSS